jgi:hypothetical protein
MKSFTYRIALGNTIQGNLGFCFDVELQRADEKQIPTGTEIIDEAIRRLQQHSGEAITVELTGLGDACLYLDTNDRGQIKIEDGDDFIDQ